MGTRAVPFTRELYIDASDFALVPPPKFFRLKPDSEVRLMGAYIMKCGEIIRNEDGTIKEIHTTVDLESGNGNPVDGRKIKGTIHWLSAEYAEEATVILYNRLFTVENMNEIDSADYDKYLNPESAVTVEHVKVEKALADAQPGEQFQFVRDGYYCKDTKRENTFNRVVTLKDSFKA